MKPNQAITNPDFAPGTWRRPRNVHTLALRIAEQLQERMADDDAAERRRRIEVGDRIRELREPRTQRWLAEKVGVTERALQAWEAGTSGITWENVEATAAALNVNPEYILLGNDRRPSPDVLDQINERLTRMEELLADLALRVAAREISGEGLNGEQRQRGPGQSDPGPESQAPES